jgi:hypothetical protein
MFHRRACSGLTNCVSPLQLQKATLLSWTAIFHPCIPIRRPPTGKVHEGCVVALKRLEATGDLDAATLSARQQVLMVAQPDLSTCAQVAADLAQSAELMLRLYSLAVQASMQELAAAAAPAAAAAAGRHAAGAAARGPAGAAAARGVGPGQGGGRGQGGTSRGGTNLSALALQNKASRQPMLLTGSSSADHHKHACMVMTHL